MGDSTALVGRLEAVKSRIAAASNGRQVTLVAVSKRQPLWKIRAAYDAGQRDFGENLAQEMAEKSHELKELCPQIRFHFIGRVQRNKAAIIRTATLIHGVGAERHLVTLAGPDPADVLLQINTGNEPQKNGFLPSEVPQQIPRGINLKGLMVLPPQGEDPVPHFEYVAKLRVQMGLEHASMGMSGDFEAAIRAGSTMVRVGTAIFGSR